MCVQIERWRDHLSHGLQAQWPYVDRIQPASSNLELARIPEEKFADEFANHTQLQIHSYCGATMKFSLWSGEVLRRSPTWQSVRDGCPLIVSQRECRVMKKTIRNAYRSGPDEAALAMALLCLLMSLTPPVLVYVTPTTFYELSRMDGLHRISCIGSACFSACVFLSGYAAHQRRSVAVFVLTGFILLFIACITGTDCCSGFFLWAQGQITFSQIPEGAVLSTVLSPLGSSCLIAGHSLNLRWSRRSSKQSVNGKRT